jgi:hypothetical protein
VILYVYTHIQASITLVRSSKGARAMCERIRHELGMKNSRNTKSIAASHITITSP